MSIMPGAIPGAMHSRDSGAKHERTDVTDGLTNDVVPSGDISPVRYAHGTTKPRYLRGEGPCFEEGCDTIARERGLCKTHFYGRKRRGEPLPESLSYIRIAPEARFFAKVAEDPAGCWIWTAGKSEGYGRFLLTNRPRTMVYAHRWVYEFMVGEIPQGLQLDHLCRNHACVNPWHLDPVTNQVNTQRGAAGDLRHLRKSA